jgi:predicted nucleotidyltransferase
LGLTEELADALAILNELKDARIIEDYAIGGGHAIIHHEVEYASIDLDIFAIVVSEDSLRILQPIYKYFRERGYEEKREHIYVGNVPIQIFPNVSPLHNDAVKEADKVEVKGIPTKVIGVEHLIALSLIPFRQTDKWRIRELLAKANHELLNNILDRFGNEENQLHTRYQEVLAGS